MQRLFLTVLFLFAGLSAEAFAEITVKDPWARATVPQQQASGAFMELTADSNARLLQARSSVASVVEIHEMKMENDVMKMKAISGLDLPAGKPVALRPGSYHVMLMGLKQPLLEGAIVPLTLLVEQGGRQETIEVKAQVRALNFQPKSEIKH